MRLSRLVMLLLLVIVALPAGSASAARGENPFEAERVGNANFVGVGTIAAGGDYWFIVEYPGNGQPIGVTLQMRDTDRPDLVTMNVNVRTRRDETIGDPNADWNGFSRIGLLEKTDNIGSDQKFWFNSAGDPDVYYLRLTNKSAGAVRFTLTIRRNDQPAPGVAFLNEGGPVALTQPAAPPRVEPTPAPRPAPAPGGPEFTVVNRFGATSKITLSASPASAPWVENDQVMLSGILEGRQSGWFKLDYPAENQRLGVTAQSAPVPGWINPFDVMVNIRTRKDETLGDPNLDVAGYSRIGQVTKTDNTEANQKYWLNFTGGMETYYFKVVNNTDDPLSFALGIRQNDLPVPAHILGGLLPRG